MVEIIMVASGKGGTGKSTVSCFLARSFAQKGEKVLVAEVDTRIRSVDLILGAEQRAVYDMGDVLEGRISPFEAVTRVPGESGLYILPASFQGTNADLSGFEGIVNSLYDEFDYIIRDVSAAPGSVFDTVCKVSSIGIVVVTADAVSVRGGRAVSDKMYREGLDNIRLVVNKFDREIFSHSGFVDLDRVIDSVCAQLLGVVPISEGIAAASVRGEPLGEKTSEKRVFDALAARLSGNDIPIII